AFQSYLNLCVLGALCGWISGDWENKNPGSYPPGSGVEGVGKTRFGVPDLIPRRPLRTSSRRATWLGMNICSPLTVAGQRRICTGFAITISAVSSADTLPHQRW